MPNVTKCAQRLYHGRNPSDLWLFLALIVSTIAIASLYISAEQYFYYWDLSRYSDQTFELATAVKKSPLSAILLFLESLGEDYNRIPCLPLLPFAVLFGHSRLVFIVSLALVYIPPFCLITGAIATNVIQGQSRLVFWGTTFLALFFPPTWIPILRGYPDLGGAVIVALALLLYWQDPFLKQRKNILSLAGLLAFAALFRRHFAYSVRAFIFTIVLYDLIIFFSRKARIDRPFAYLFNLLIRVLYLAGLFLIFSPVLVVKTLSINYRELYASYEESIFAGIQYYGHECGWWFWVIAASGFILGFKFKIFYPKNSILLTLFSINSVIQWICFAKQLSLQYTTHFILFLIIGTITYMVAIFKIVYRYPRFLVISINSFMLGLNFFIALFPLQKINIHLNNTLQVLFARNQPPLFRDDYDRVIGLIQFLKKTITLKENVYIAASSITLNDSIFEVAQDPSASEKLSILRTANIDSRDVYPLNRLLNADVVVVATPVQYHLQPSVQKIVKYVVDTFDQNTPFSQDFKLINQQVYLKNGVVVTLYQRVRPTSLKTAMAAIRSMRAQIPKAPTREPYWLTLHPKRVKEIYKDLILDQVYIPAAHLNDPIPISFLYFGAIPKSLTLTETFRVAKACAPNLHLSVQLSALNQDGVSLATATQTFVPTQQDTPAFQLSTPVPATVLRMDVTTVPAPKVSDRCKVDIENIQIKSK